MRGRVRRATPSLKDIGPWLGDPLPRRQDSRRWRERPLLLPAGSGGVAAATA